MSTARRILSAAAIIPAGVTAAVYTVFSTSTMPRLASLPAADGLARMQEFNRDAVQPPFMLCFFGAAALSVAAIAAETRRPRGDRSLVRIGAGAAYLTGFAITVAFHVPRNDALAVLDPLSPASVAPWTAFVEEWTAGNTVRAALSAGATIAFAVGAARTAQNRHLG
jgi:uncharacterized membrane protein